MMRAKPYVGITGFKTGEEVDVVNAIFEKNGFNQNFSHLPMYGFIVTDKRLADVMKEGTQSPKFVNLPLLASLLPSTTLPMMHYYTDNKDNLADEIEQVFSYGAMYWSGDCRAVQLNVDWPPLKQIEKIKTMFEEMAIVLQLPARAMEGKTTAEITRQAKEYDGLVSFALIDPSGGLGLDFDLERSLELMASLYQAMPTTQIGVAGGFSGENVEERVWAIQGRYSEPFCIDAQGKLRDDHNKGKLDLEKVQLYIEKAARVLRE